MTDTIDRSDLLTELSDGVRRLTTSAEWERYLEFQSRFYRYSPNNVILILAQRRDATFVAGFRTWKKLDRVVRKGEKGIWILAPMFHWVADDVEDTQRRTIHGFRWVPVFDLAQTDGADVPRVCHPLSGGDDDGLFERLIEVAHSIGFRVEETELAGGANGDCAHDLCRIRVAPNAPAQQVKTLAHEIAHAFLHRHFENRSLAELEAESVAYVVCQCLGIDTSDYSFGYVATWAGGGDEAIGAIKASCSRIQHSVSTILCALEATGEELDPLVDLSRRTSAILDA